MYCSNCGNEINSVSKYCPHCGEKLENVDPIIAGMRPLCTDEEKSSIKSEKEDLNSYEEWVKKEKKRKKLKSSFLVSLFTVPVLALIMYMFFYKEIDNLYDNYPTQTGIIFVALVIITFIVLFIVEYNKSDDLNDLM